MIASTLLLLSMMAMAYAIVDVGPIRPIDPIPPRPIVDPIPPRPIDPIWPPWNSPCNCEKVHCPKGFHCEMRRQTPIFFAPREPTCVPNFSPIG